ncbi:hypothetical protein OROMI_000906 [Orobanche minor]
MMDVKNEDEWDACKKVDTNARLMRYKGWPYYDDWCEIFGKDRATGAKAEDVMDAVNEMLKNENIREKDIAHNDIESVDELEENVISRSTFQFDTNGADKKLKRKKRKSLDDDTVIIEKLGNFLENAQSRLGEIAQCIGYEYDAKISRKELFEMMDAIGGMLLQDKLRVSDMLIQNTERLKFFQSLTGDARSEYVKMLLNNMI